MKIALIGYGKMGKTLEVLAEADGHEIVLKIDQDNYDDLTADNLQKADVAIEFTRPESAFDNITACINAGVPVVSGTTAWLDQYDKVVQQCEEKGGAFFYASNYSIGVNILFAINRQLAKLMNEQPQYEVSMEEIHHTAKLDAPSGTAITIAEGIIDEVERKKDWVNDENAGTKELSIISKRVDPAPGTHVIQYSSVIDTITLSHEAHTRAGFARGALAAALWLVGKKGVFGMKDMLGF
ncbi:MAG: 4-hydroxy-tetrahydrodipicolinate reductase [Bacteroidota bacterium]